MTLSCRNWFPPPVGYLICSEAKCMILVCVFCHFWNPLPVSLTLVPKSGEGVFFLCVFQQQAVQNSLLDGDRSGVQKTRKIADLLARKVAGGRLTPYKCKENRNLQGCWKGHEY